MHQEKGITLVVLAVTIIVMLILAGTATYVGNDVLVSGKRTAFVTQLQMIQEKVKLYHQKGEKTYQNLGQVLTTELVSSEKQAEILDSVKEIGITSLNAYRYFDRTNYDQIELSGIKQETLVNFKTKQVISVEGLKANGKLNYTIEQLGEGQYEVPYDDKGVSEITYKINPVIDSENTWTFMVDNSSIKYPGQSGEGILKYRKKNIDDWKETQNFTFRVKEPGIYETKIVDKLGNESKIIEVYAYVKEGLLLYLDGENNTGIGHDNLATTWKDLSGNENDSLLKGFDQTVSSGWNDKSLYFDGINDSAETKKIVDFKGSKAFTIDFTDINGELYNSPRSILFETSENSNLNYGSFYINTREYGNRDITLAMKYNENNITKINHKMVDAIMEQNKNKTYAINYDSTKAFNQYISIYANGDRLEVKAPSDDKTFDADITGLPLKNYKLYIANRVGSVGYTRMNLGGVRLYNRTLTQQEIKINYEIDKDRFKITE